MQQKARKAIDELEARGQSTKSLWSPGCHNSLAKLLDEYNFATYTLPAPRAKLILDVSK